jgi:crotonobetainyl-CoA:carnitine CoA-transferase CaiB-like acyl-CoA transferase
MERLGFDYHSVQKKNPTVVYGEISGYGQDGPWKNLPGQDLLVQSLSGLTWLSGNDNGGPTPMGLSIVDMLSGAHLVQGILACLVRRSIKGVGGLVQVSLLESALDLQFETITTFFNDGGAPTVRSAVNGAHAYLGAPYGIYKTKDGYMALAMGSIPRLGDLLGCQELLKYQQVELAFLMRDRIKSALAAHLANETTSKWLSILEPADIWCAEVFSWDKLLKHEGFKALDMVQDVVMEDGYKYKTTRCPIRIDGEILTSPKGSPKLGQDNSSILEDIVNSKLTKTT